jgi:hypothetical protein
MPVRRTTPHCIKAEGSWIVKPWGIKLQRFSYAHNSPQRCERRERYLDPWTSVPAIDAYQAKTARNADPDASNVIELCQNAGNALLVDSNARVTGWFFDGARVLLAEAVWLGNNYLSGDPEIPVLIVGEIYHATNQIMREFPPKSAK